MSESNLDKIFITASGGPLLNVPIKKFKHLKISKIIKHPNWDMGAKISVDSATMMNKGLELIEAHHLFSLSGDMIDVLIHPESIIHALVNFRDGSSLAQLSAPDMRSAIAFALNYPNRSYLDVNCGHCHSPSGNANSTGLYLHLNETRDINLGIFKKPVATGRGSGGYKYSIVPGKPEESILLYRMESMDPGVMMPESGRALTHQEAVEMVRDWIYGL